MKNVAIILRLAGSVLWLVAVLYLAIAGAAWSFRNPIANESTFFTEFPSVITFKKLDKYQAP